MLVLGTLMVSFVERLSYSLSAIYNRPGIFYGQCSEICGANHAYSNLWYQLKIREAMAEPK